MWPEGRVASGAAATQHVSHGAEPRTGGDTAGELPPPRPCLPRHLLQVIFGGARRLVRPVGLVGHGGAVGLQRSLFVVPEEGLHHHRLWGKGARQSKPGQAGLPAPGALWAAPTGPSAAQL